MKARYQYRFYPTDQQRLELSKLFGCVRVAWNDALALCKNQGKVIKSSELQRICLTQAKQTEEKSWLAEVSSVPLQQSIADLNTAYKNFFDSLSGKRKGIKVKPPRFKKKTSSQSARFIKAAFKLKSDNVYLAKIGNVKTICSRPLPSEPSSVTVIKDCANRYFLSFVVEINPEYIEPVNESVGIDLGIKTFAVLSSREFIKSPNYQPHYRKIRKLQRKLARQQKDSKRREVTRLRIARLHNKIVDTRKDFLHKVSTKIVRENQTIVLEDLNVSGMIKNRKLSRVISQQGWREFRTMLNAKARIQNRNFQVISKWEPTSQVVGTNEAN